MGYMTDGLTFNVLRAANQRRLPGFKNARGETTDHTTWTANDWLTAVAGELGELANLLKKIRRGDFTLEDVRDDVANELADVQTYLDILAASLHVNLGRATIAKFNAVSRRVQSQVRIADDGSDWHLYPVEGS
jgi:NTP pyrophosphatase (non-canonical NTP hydrolase)